ncbi:hypothetical protein [Streptomyces sp. NPDC101181]|uniref:hypothetical protein n=1 Tax=Streptomyces sp. NPDC101181 TaxID=3366125 RepID=UPI0037F4CC21
MTTARREDVAHRTATARRESPAPGMVTALRDGTTRPPTTTARRTGPGEPR